MSRSDALIEGQGRDQGSGPPGKFGSPVGGTVVDDHHVCPRHMLAGIGDYGLDRLLLVPGWNEDKLLHAAILACRARRGGGFNVTVG